VVATGLGQGGPFGKATFELRVVFRRERWRPRGLGSGRHAGLRQPSEGAIVREELLPGIRGECVPASQAFCDERSIEFGDDRQRSTAAVGREREERAEIPTELRGLQPLFAKFGRKGFVLGQLGLEHAALRLRAAAESRGAPGGIRVEHLAKDRNGRERRLRRRSGCGGRGRLRPQHLGGGHAQSGDRESNTHSDAGGDPGVHAIH
jgi:hypothetical protein